MKKYIEMLDYLGLEAESTDASRRFHAAGNRFAAFLTAVCLLYFWVLLFTRQLDFLTVNIPLNIALVASFWILKKGKLNVPRVLVLIFGNSAVVGFIVLSGK